MYIRPLLVSAVRVILPLACLSTIYLYLYPVFHGCAFPSVQHSTSTHSRDYTLLVESFRDTLLQHLPERLAAVVGDRNVLLEDQSANKASHLAPFRLLVLADPQIEGDSSLPKKGDGFAERLRCHWRTVFEAREHTGSQAGEVPATAAEDEETKTEPEEEVVVEGLRTEYTAPEPETVAPSPGRTRLVVQALRTICLSDIPYALSAARKRIDLFGNDYYLAHIYRTLNWWTIPSHITVLGDLIGSQWVKDDEFDWRGWRYWNRVMAGGERVQDEITLLADDEEEKVFKINDPSWKRRVINIAGNHDIGYAGDISEERLERFVRVFGQANWDVRFEYPARINATADDEKPPSLHLINLNSLVLDTPALAENIQSATYAYMNSVITHRLRSVEDKSVFTLMLTHLPLFKKAGICVDAPFFDFWGNDDGGGVYRPRGLKEQNHLSRHASEPGMLESIFGMKGDVAAAGQGKGRHGLILNGHDHEGCDTWHYIHINRTWNSSEDPPSDRKTQWMVSRYEDADLDTTYTGIREITLRSMMGDFGGNAGLLSAWYDFHQKSWKYDFQTCKLGVQHVWWAVHILDLVALGLATALLLSTAVNASKSNLAPDKHDKHSKSNGSVKKKQ